MISAASGPRKTRKPTQRGPAAAIAARLQRTARQSCFPQRRYRHTYRELDSDSSWLQLSPSLLSRRAFRPIRRPGVSRSGSLRAAQVNLAGPGLSKSLSTSSHRTSSPAAQLLRANSCNPAAIRAPGSGHIVRKKYSTGAAWVSRDSVQANRRRIALTLSVPDRINRLHAAS